MLFLSQNPIHEKTVLLRVDFNVPLNPDGSIASDERIIQTLPTIKNLLENGNKLVIISHLGQPVNNQPSLKVVADKLSELLGLSVTFCTNYQNLPIVPIILLENLRFDPREKKGSSDFGQELSKMADIFVNDAFAVAHRSDASVTQINLPSLGGFLIEKEVKMLDMVMKSAKKPLVSIVSGAKISTKLGLIKKLLTISDTVLIGGGIANVLLKLKGVEIGQSLGKDEIVEGFEFASNLILPIDARVLVDGKAVVRKLQEVAKTDVVLDIGPETEILFAQIIQKAQTVVWNGPLGYTENPIFANGTKAIYSAVIEAPISIVGGGDTLSCLANAPSLSKITHLSTGGGAMLEYIEKEGRLPAINFLNNHDDLAPNLD